MTRANVCCFETKIVTTPRAFSRGLITGIAPFLKNSLPMQFREGLACNIVGVTRRVRHAEGAREKFHLIFRVCVIKEHICGISSLCACFNLNSIKAID